MRYGDVLRAWRSILSGRAPSLSIEITRECPLRCPGCYAYETNHLGGAETLRDLSDFRGDDLVARTLELVDRLRPLHLSIVGGDPLVRYREMETLIPQIIDRGIHVQLVTSAFRTFPQEWSSMRLLTVAVSIDGLPAEHDVRRQPATYERILKNIAQRRITVHCTVTAQMLNRPGYLDEFVAFWSARDEVERIWFSLFTPQRGVDLPECLSPLQREQVISELFELRVKYPKADLPAKVLEQFLRPPSSPAECIFAQTTEIISADLRTRVTPCQFGGDPDCSQCGCYASMGLAAVGGYRLGGFIPLASIFHASAAIGRTVAAVKRHSSPVPEVPQPPTVLITLKAPSEDRDLVS